MYIRKLVVRNFKSLRNTEIELNPHLNIIVGDNESGKSTLLEAINLVLSSQIKGRNIQFELTPYLFNDDAVKEYLGALRSGKKVEPPKITIEAYFDNDKDLAQLKGTNCLIKGENCPGLKFSIELKDDFAAEYEEYIRSPDLRTVPIDCYEVNWESFSRSEKVTSRNLPIKANFIDTSLLKSMSGTDKYIAKIISSNVEPKQLVELALSYRKMKDVFLQEDNVKQINAVLSKHKGDITDKDISISMDMSSRSALESLTLHLDDIPFVFAGQGEQSSVQMKLAIDSSNKSQILLIEEPENHLSYPNMNNLISKISEKGANKQIIIATHSSFVLNKLGVENVILFNSGRPMKLKNLSPETEEYFMKLPGHDTLRLILSKKAVLVEGPSDELIVQKAYFKKYGVKPLDNGVDIISVQSLAFKRFLEIGKALDLTISVVTDNDGDIGALEKKYANYLAPSGKIGIYYDKDITHPTLEPQIVKVNSLELLNKVFDSNFADKESLTNYMKNNKTDCALKIFNSTDDIVFPEYIENAIT
jgi:putative ATP-dependent endonuclease of the OLD family